MTGRAASPGPNLQNIGPRLALEKQREADEIKRVLRAALQSR